MGTVEVYHYEKRIGEFLVLYDDGDPTLMFEFDEVD
jgi:hypothetical protein